MTKFVTTALVSTILGLSSATVTLSQSDSGQLGLELFGLLREDSEAYVSTLNDLIIKNDENAVEAAKLLVDVVVMVGGHSIEHMDKNAQAHDMGIIVNVNEVLRSHTLHPNPKLREAIVPYLFNIGDEATFEAIRTAEESGKIPNEEALSYFISAPPEVGNIELRRYAEGDSDDLANRAIQVLSSDISQQDYVRDQFLVNPKADNERRGYALGGLAAYDDNFASYVTSPEVVDFALDWPVVPGSTISGAQLIEETLRANITDNPNLKPFYERTMRAASDALKAGDEGWKGTVIENQILRSLNNDIKG